MTENYYDREKNYLSAVIQKIKDRIGQINERISSGQKEIDSMHDYYWQNYTEMDEYGYENYDNQQALLRQMESNQAQARMRSRLKRMLDSPYFGRVDFQFEDEDDAESFYIGIGNFAEKTGEVPLIYDWRAPVSGLFYDYDSGPASYEAPSGRIPGMIRSKWQYQIRGGKLIYAFESDTKIDDDILKAALGTNSDVQLKNIVSTIQKEQNAIIRNTKDRILAIQGAAGSGKTSIALHRIAYLLYHDRENLKSSNILILSPNSVFSDYISHILPELGEENIREMSFDLFAYKELRSTADDCEDRYDQLERQMKFPDDEAQKRCGEKQGKAFIGLMESFLAILEEELVEFRDVEFKGVKKTEEELISLFYFKFQNTPLLKRMGVIADYFIDEYETLRGRDLAEEEREFIKEKFDRMYVTCDVYEIYNWMLGQYGYEKLPETEYERRKVPYEDVYPMLYLKYRLEGQTRQRQIKHLVIDEMQDYSYLQYTILHDMFTCRMTILGDKAQTLEEKQRDVLVFLPSIFGKDMRKIVIDKSYRNTMEIARYAAKTADIPCPQLLMRHGKEVEESSFGSLDKLTDRIAENVRLGEGEYETAAILLQTEDEAYDFFDRMTKKLSGSDVSVNYIDRNSSAFRKGVTVTTWYLAKGLEFDQVFSVALKENAPLGRQAAYIGATRALHELYMFSVRQA